MRRTFMRSIAGIATIGLVGGTLAGCSREAVARHPWGHCSVLGGVAGAVVGGGGAAGVAYATGPDGDHRHDEAGTAAMIGVLVGGILGAIIGHYTCDPETPPPAPTKYTPPPPPPPAAAPVKEKLVLRGVHFDFDKSDIRPGDAAVLDEVAQSLKGAPGTSVDVNGYCDIKGTERYNQALSERRAAAVVRYLVKAGIPASQLEPHGYGKTNFVATNDTAEGRAQNRRVELVPKQ